MRVPGGSLKVVPVPVPGRTGVRGLAAAVCTAVVTALLTGVGLPAEASTVRVVAQQNPSCSDAGPGTSGTPYCTISAGAKAAAAGDTVSVQAGTYRETVTAPSGVKFQTSAGAQVVGTDSAGLRHMVAHRRERLDHAAQRHRRPHPGAQGQHGVDEGALGRRDDFEQLVLRLRDPHVVRRPRRPVADHGRRAEGGAVLRLPGPQRHRRDRPGLHRCSAAGCRRGVPRYIDRLAGQRRHGERLRAPTASTTAAARRTRSPRCRSCTMAPSASGSSMPSTPR